MAGAVGGRVRDEQAEPRQTAAADAAAQLVQLGDPEPVGVQSTIVVALATSTPTSMTVVETRTSTSPAAKARMVRSLSSGAIRPCILARRSPARGPSASSTTRSSTARSGQVTGCSPSSTPTYSQNEVSTATCSESSLVIRGQTT